MARRAAVVLVLSLLLIVTGACRWQAEDDGQCDLVVENGGARDLKIMVDGWEAGVVREGSVRTVDNIAAGRHIIEAMDGESTVVERRYIELSRGEDYFWRIARR
jgi:hypothetical protein